MNCEVLPIKLKLKREFIVAGGREKLKKNFIFIIQGQGLGEAAGSIHYGVSADEIEADLKRAVDFLGDLEDDVDENTISEIGVDLCSPAQCAISTAWHDWQARRINQSLYERLGLGGPPPAETSITVSVGDWESLVEQVKSGHKHIKIKMDCGDNRNEELIRLMDESSGVIFRIDANGSWSYDDAEKALSSLLAGKIELIEQPFPADATDDWERLRSQCSIPLFMDESIVSAADVKRCAGFVDGVNIKIQKSGRLETAIEAMKTARALGLRVMLGCMIESSVGIATAYHLSSLADCLDLDGRLLIEGDPFSGLTYEEGQLKIVSESGHGISFA
jgi:L-alanine-DL-glutamate epimerase-like enolase superfamily enzyme